MVHLLAKHQGLKPSIATGFSHLLTLPNKIFFTFLKYLLAHIIATFCYRSAVIMAVFVKKMTFSIKNKCIVFLKHVRWPREINVLQLQKTHANRKSTSKARKHLHQFDSRCCKCTQHKQIKRHAANAHNQGRRYGFWAPWTAYSLGPSCVLGGGGYGGWRWLVWIWVPIRTDRSSGVVGLPLRTDHVPVESPSVEIAIAFPVEHGSQI